MTVGLRRTLSTLRLLREKACSDGTVYLNVPSLTLELGTSKRTLMRTLRSLREIGMIEWVSRHRGVYRIVSPWDPWAACPSPDSDERGRFASHRT